MGELPSGVVNLVTETGHEVAQALVASPDVDVLSFPGASVTGAWCSASFALPDHAGWRRG